MLWRSHLRLYPENFDKTPHCWCETVHCPSRVAQSRSLLHCIGRKGRSNLGKKKMKSHSLPPINITCGGLIEGIFSLICWNHFLTEWLRLLLTSFSQLFSFITGASVPYQRVLLKPLCMWGMCVCVCTWECLCASLHSFVCVRKAGVSQETALVPVVVHCCQRHTRWLIIVSVCWGETLSDMKDHRRQHSQEECYCCADRQTAKSTFKSYQTFNKTFFRHWAGFFILSRVIAFLMHTMM